MKKLVIIVILVGVGAFLWWAFSPLLYDVEVQDELDPALVARLEAQRQADERAQRQAAEQPTATTSGTPAEATEAEDESETSTPVPEIEPEIFIDGPFPIIDTPGHPATGGVEVIHSPEETLIRYLNYDGTNGPDLEIYLAKDLEANEFVSLGRAKGNQGTLIYGVPFDIDIDEYRYVLTWCEAFGVLFDYAEIN